MKKLDTIKYSFSIQDLAIDAKKVERQAKMDENMPSYSDFLEHEMETHLLHSKIQGGYSMLPSVITSDRIQIKNLIFETGDSISSKFIGSDLIAVFACTAGPEISARIKQLNEEGLFLEAYLLDTLGSMLVETAMDQIQEKLDEDCFANGLKITNRYSPGYSHWNVKEQKKLFSLLPTGFCGVQLSESCLMSPVKSISGFIGIGKNVRYQKHDCIECFSENCLFRNSTKHCKSNR